MKSSFLVTLPLLVAANVEFISKRDFSAILLFGIAVLVFLALAFGSPGFYLQEKLKNRTSLRQPVSPTTGKGGSSRSDNWTYLLSFDKPYAFKQQAFAFKTPGVIISAFCLIAQVLRLLYCEILVPTHIEISDIEIALVIFYFLMFGWWLLVITEDWVKKS